MKLEQIFIEILKGRRLKVYGSRIVFPAYPRLAWCGCLDQNHRTYKMTKNYRHEYSVDIPHASGELTLK